LPFTWNLRSATGARDDFLCRFQIGSSVRRKIASRRGAGNSMRQNLLSGIG